MKAKTNLMTVSFVLNKGKMNYIGLPNMMTADFTHNKEAVINYEGKINNIGFSDVMTAHFENEKGAE